MLRPLPGSRTKRKKKDVNGLMNCEIFGLGYCCLVRCLFVLFLIQKKKKCSFCLFVVVCILCFAVTLLTVGLYSQNEVGAELCPLF